MAMKARYTVVNGEVIAEKRDGVRKFYVPDGLGSTVALLDNTQSKADTFGYWPYGEETSRTGTTPTPFRFVGTPGYYRDAAQRTYVRARHLQPGYGRWMTRDPLRGTEPPYAYVRGNPTTFLDPMGLQTKPPPQGPQHLPPEPIFQTLEEQDLYRKRMIEEYRKRYQQLLELYDPKDKPFDFRWWIDFYTLRIEESYQNPPWRGYVRWSIGPDGEPGPIGIGIGYGDRHSIAIGFTIPPKDPGGVVFEFRGILRF